MERQFRLNWQAIVEEAKQRRKSQKLTQRRLAELAGVSTPTVSRFENGARDIQLSSITSILGMLGMIDERTLVFGDAPAQDAGEAVRFTGADGNRAILCAISREALEDHFGGDHTSLLKAFTANRERIEHEARRKYLAGRLEQSGSVMLTTEDF